MNIALILTAFYFAGLIVSTVWQIKRMPAKWEEIRNHPRLANDSEQYLRNVATIAAVISVIIWPIWMPKLAIHHYRKGKDRPHG